MKVRSAVKKICADCKLVKRGRKQFVICAANARHKQRQGFATLAGPATLAPWATMGDALSPTAGAAAGSLSLSFTIPDEDL